MRERIKRMPLDVDICPECGSGNISVHDSRNYNGYRSRRRTCIGCGYRYTTYEVFASEYNELVSKGNAEEMYTAGFKAGMDEMGKSLARTMEILRGEV